MPINNEHLDTTCQVWDGYGYKMMPLADAKKAQRAGAVQITKDLQAKDLKRPDEFKSASTDATSQTEPAAKAKGSYKTRQMKASDDRT